MPIAVDFGERMAAGRGENARGRNVFLQLKVSDPRQKSKKRKREEDDTYETENMHGGVVDGKKIEEKVRRR